MQAPWSLLKNKKNKIVITHKSHLLFSPSDYLVKQENTKLNITLNFLSLLGAESPLPSFLANLKNKSSLDDKAIVNIIEILNLRCFEILRDALYFLDELPCLIKPLHQYTKQNLIAEISSPRLSMQKIMNRISHIFKYPHLNMETTGIWSSPLSLHTLGEHFNLNDAAWIGERCFIKRKLVLHIKEMRQAQRLEFIKPKYVFQLKPLKDQLLTELGLTLFVCFHVKNPQKTLRLGEPIFLGEAWLGKLSNSILTTEFDYLQLAGQHRLH